MATDLIFCKNCVMDGTASEIRLDEQGVCNFCHQAQRELALIKLNNSQWNDLAKKIKKDSKGKYDVIIGLSGGIDSSYALLCAVEAGLRPLAFGMDNGYNSGIADENVMRIVEGLKVPYERRVIDLVAFKKLQAAFIKSGVPNIEIPTDHVIMALTYQIAAENGIKWIISGGNVASESIMPPSWGYSARDLTHIKDIYKKMTGKKLKGLPTCGIIKWNIYRWWYGIKTVYILDYIDYNVERAKEKLKERFGWKDYYGKHSESLFTWWFQSYYLFEKFGIDKRKAHYSSLINSGQMTRKEAMLALADKPVYPRLGLEEKIFKYPKRSHDEFKKDEKWYKCIAIFVRLLKKLSPK